MKIARSLFLAAILLLTLPSLQAQVRNADSMIHRIFASLKAKDQKAFVALYPNAQQFSRFMRNMMEQTLKSEDMKKLMETDEKSKNMNLDSLIDAQVATFSNPEMVGKMEQGFGEMFRKIIEKGEKKGVNWSAATLAGYTIDTAAFGGEGTSFQPKGIKEAKGVIDFTVGNDAYQLAYSKVMLIESEGGWFGAEFPQLARKGESLEPEREMETDSVTTTVTEMEPTPPPPPAAKKPATKTKQKSPARKPKAKV